MGSFDMNSLVKLAFLGMLAALFIAGGMAGFAVASVINLGKLCL